MISGSLCINSYACCGLASFMGSPLSRIRSEIIASHKPLCTSQPTACGNYFRKTISDLRKSSSPTTDKSRAGGMGEGLIPLASCEAERLAHSQTPEQKALAEIDIHRLKEPIAEGRVERLAGQGGDGGGGPGDPVPFGGL